MDFTSRLLYRRQFILSSLKFDYFDDWNCIQLNHGFRLSVHPDLELTESASGKIRLVVLGFILDPFRPEMSNQDVLNDLSNHAECFEGLITSTEKYGGRWVIIYMDESRINILHDPCGQRQVYYHVKDGGIICASDTSIINHFFHLQPDHSRELKQFLASASYRQNENKWIGDGTIYLQTKHLMPNHYLNLLKRKTIRYWPINPLGELGLHEGVVAGNKILEGTLKAAGKRKRLAMAVTAGMDSRILLAASKAIRNEITYYVSVQGTDYEDTPDFYVPNNLFKRLKLPFYTQQCNDPFPEGIEKIFRENISTARVHLNKSKFIYKYLLEFQDKMIINGNACEIFRIIPYLRPLRYRRPTAIHLAREFLDSHDIPYVEYQIDSWLKEIRAPCIQNHLDIYGMINWEQRLGNWGALYPAEQDIAVDQLSPFNNRLLIRLMMSVNLKYRIFPKYILFMKMIKASWPEILCEPINPKSLKAFIRVWGRHLLIKHTNRYKKII